MAVTEGDRIAYTTQAARYQGVALHVSSGRVIAALAIVSTERVEGIEHDVVGRESTIPVILPIDDVEVLS
jgi:hypothetical protein